MFAPQLGPHSAISWPFGLFLWVCRVELATARLAPLLSSLLPQSLSTGWAPVGAWPLFQANQGGGNCRSAGWRRACGGPKVGGCRVILGVGAPPGDCTPR